MTDRNVIKMLLRQKEITQAQLAEKAGLKSQGNVTGILNRKTGNMNTSTFLSFLEALNSDMVIYDITTHRKYRVSLNGLNIKAVLRTIMGEKHVTQQWLAEQRGLTQGSISNYVHGNNNSLHVRNAIELCEAMGCVLSVYDRDTGNAYEIDNNDEGFMINI